jgi:hypothetical protein
LAVADARIVRTWVGWRQVCSAIYPVWGTTFSLGQEIESVGDRVVLVRSDEVVLPCLDRGVPADERDAVDVVGAGWDVDDVLVGEQRPGRDVDAELGTTSTMRRLIGSPRSR